MPARRAAVEVWLLAAAAGASLPLQAQTAPAQQIQIEARSDNATDQRRNALVSMTVIDRDELDQHGDASVLDVLQRLPGITLDGEVPRFRGLGAGYTQILINGEPAPPGFSLDQIAPAEIERIEIVKGPTAEFSGVAGTINVILRVPPRTLQRELRVHTSYRGLRPVGSLNLSWGDRVGALGFQLPVATYQWAGNGSSQSWRLSRLPSGELREQQVSGRDQWHGGGLNFGPRFDWRFSEFETLQWQTFLQAHRSGNRSSSHIDVLQGTPPTVIDSSNRNQGDWQMARSQLQWQRRTPEGQRFELKASWQATLGRSDGRYLGLEGSGVQALQRNTHNRNEDGRVSVGARLRLPWAEGHALLAGADLERRERDELRRVVENGVELFTGSVGRAFDARMDRLVLFVQDELLLSSRQSALLGLRVESIASTAATTAEPVTQRASTVSPVLHFRHAFDDKGRNLVRASLSRSSRLPDLSTLMGRYSLNTTYERNVSNTPLAADSAGNPRLRPERAWAADVAIENYLPGGGVLSASVFQRRIEGLIRRRIGLETVPDASAPRWVSRPVNFGSALSSGAELEIKGRGEDLLPALFAPRSGWNLRASVSRYRSSVEQIDDPDARLEGQPPWSATLGFDRQLPRSIVSFGASLAYTPAFATQQTDLQRIWRSQARNVDAFLLLKFSRELHLRLSVNNAAPLDARSASSVQDLDGFTARSESLRPGVAQYSANLMLRF